MDRLQSFKVRCCGIDFASAISLDRCVAGIHQTFRVHSFLIKRLTFKLILLLLSTDV